MMRYRKNLLTLVTTLYPQNSFASSRKVFDSLFIIVYLYYIYWYCWACCCSYTKSVFSFTIIIYTFIVGCKRDLSLRDRDIRLLVRDETEIKTFLQFHETKTRPRRLVFATRRDGDLARPRPRLLSRPSAFSVVPKRWMANLPLLMSPTAQSLQLQLQCSLSWNLFTTWALKHNTTKHNYIFKKKTKKIEMWANAQCDGRHAEYQWRPLFNAAKLLIEIKPWATVCKMVCPMLYYHCLSCPLQAVLSVWCWYIVAKWLDGSGCHSVWK